MQKSSFMAVQGIDIDSGTLHLQCMGHTRHTAASSLFSVKVEIIFP